MVACPVMENREDHMRTIGALAVLLASTSLTFAGPPSPPAENESFIGGGCIQRCFRQSEHWQ